MPAPAIDRFFIAPSICGPRRGVKIPGISCRTPPGLPPISSDKKAHIAGLPVKIYAE
jgi:hypothetical protein